MLPFEEVWIDDGRGPRRKISAEAFLALPMPERIRHILRQTIEFIHEGEVVGTRDALLALHAIECAEHHATAEP